MESGDPTVMGSKWPNSVYIAAGPDPFALIEKSVAAAAQLSGGAQQRQDKRQPDSLNWFGWCTWDAYYSKVSARGQLNKHSCIVLYDVTVRVVLLIQFSLDSDNLSMTPMHSAYWGTSMSSFQVQH